MSIYIQQIKSIAIPNKYTKWYCSLVEKAINRATTRKEAKLILEYVEGHHIFPVCLCNDIEKKDKNNIVYFSAREHFVVHWLLSKMFIGQIKYKMINAIAKFSQSTNDQKRIFNSNEYEVIRKNSALWQQDPSIGSKISYAISIRSEEEHTRIRKITGLKNSKHRSNKIWITNGIEDSQLCKTEIIPYGWVRGRTNLPTSWSEQRKEESKMTLASMNAEEKKAKYGRDRDSWPENSKEIWRSKMTSKKWMNNGEECKMVDQDSISSKLMSGWVMGRRLSHKRKEN